MLGCNSCDEWFHGRCVGVAEHDEAAADAFECPACRRAKAGDASAPPLCPPCFGDDASDDDDDPRARPKETDAFSLPWPPAALAAPPEVREAAAGIAAAVYEQKRREGEERELAAEREAAAARGGDDGFGGTMMDLGTS